MGAAVCRLKRRSEFLRVAAKGRKSVMPGLILQAFLNPDARCGLRVGFTASRRVGNAVARNKARRRLRAAVDAVMPAHATGGYDYVVIARAASIGRPFPSLINDLEEALKRLEIWRER